MKKKYFLPLILILGFSPIYAQSKECDCSAALNQSLKDKYSDTQLLDLRIELYEYYKFVQNTSTDKQKNFALSSDAQAFTTYGIFKGSIEGNSSNKNSKIQNLEKIIEKDQSISENVFKQFVTEVFSDNQLTAYKTCVDHCKNQSTTGVFYELSGDLEDVFALNLKFSNVVFVNQNQVTLRNNATLVNCEPIGGFILKEGLVIQNNQNITQYLKIIDKTKTAQIGINFNEISFGPINFGEGFSGSNKSCPIGTIISSSFKYETFLEVNRFEKTENMSKIIWVPCDGRNVRSSIYGQFAGNVPDLRGLFLRNVNDYKVSFDGVALVSPERANPDETAAGVFQSDSYKSHDHNYQVSENRTGFPKESADSSDGPQHFQSYWRGNKNLNSNGATTSFSGGLETRPKNVSVYYYIRIN